MSLISKYAYYGRSIVTLLAELDDPVRTVGIFTGRPRALPGVVRLRRTGWRFAVRTRMDVWILKETCVDREYLWAIRELGEAWSVVDVGAGLGDFTVLAAKACPAGVVHAYEPLPGSFALLEQNLALNAVTNVQRFEAAVASRAGSLVIPSTDVEPVKVRTTDAPVGALSVPAIDLGAVLDALPDGRCDFLKVDCEGGEYDILMDSPPELLRRIRRISLEYHEDGARGGRMLGAHLQAHGFRVRRRGSPVYAHLGLLSAERLDSLG